MKDGNAVCSQCAQLRVAEVGREISRAQFIGVVTIENLSETNVFDTNQVIALRGVLNHLQHGCLGEERNQWNVVRLAHDALLRIKEGIFDNLDHLHSVVPSPTIESAVKRRYGRWVSDREISEIEAGEIEREMENARQATIAEIRSFAESKMFWSQDRWLTFLTSVERELAAAEELASC